MIRCTHTRLLVALSLSCLGAACDDSAPSTALDPGVDAARPRPDPEPDASAPSPDPVPDPEDVAEPEPDPRDAPIEDASPEDVPSEDTRPDLPEEDLPPLPEPEACGDEVDNDLDGEVDEGCAPPVGSWVGDLAFVARFGGEGAIYRIRNDGRERRAITPPPAQGEYSDLDWSPDGQWIAWTHTLRRRDQILERQVLIADPEGVLIDTLAQGASPRFSPSSRELLLLDEAGEVVRVDLDGEVLTRYGPGLSFDWFPDGQNLVIERVEDNLSGLHVSNIEGDLTRVLVAPEQGAHQPDVSGDGQWIAYTQGFGNSARPHVIRQDGTGDRALPEIVPGRPHDEPIWHPDALLLAYSSRNLLPERAAIVDPFGDDVVEVGRGRRPRWAPDGASLLLQFDSAVVLSGALGEDQHFVTTGLDPVWNPRGLDPIPEGDDQLCKFEQTFNDLGLHRENSFTGSRWFAFRYVAERDAQISRIGFFTGEQEGTTRIEVRAHDENTDRPALDVLGETTYEQIGFVGWQYGVFDAPIVVLGGQTTWIVARFPDGSQTMFALQGERQIDYRGSDQRTGPWDGPYQNYAMIRFNLCF